MIAHISQFADSSSGIGALGIDGKAFVIQLVTFLLAFLVLKRYAFAPIIKIMRQRQETIEAGVKLGEDMKKQQAELETKVEKTLHAARQEADGIISSAQDTAQQTVREAEDKARTKADQIVAEADDRIAQDTARARRELEHELVGLVADATEAIIEEKVDTKKDAQLIQKALSGRKQKQVA